MHGTGSAGFRSIRSLRDHWSRPAGPPAYYWYLTFENTPELRALASEYQDSAAYPYYDRTPLRDLHLTLGRIASVHDVTPDQISAIESAALEACKDTPCFDVSAGGLGGTPGAIGLNICPVQPVRELRDILHAATLPVCPG